MNKKQTPSKDWKQTEHSKLHRGYGSKNLASLKGEGDRVIESHPDLFLESPPADPAIFFRQIACTADAVIRGSVLDEVSNLTDDGTFVFTDATISIEEILKDNALAPIPKGSTLTVTRPGGTIMLDGHKLTARYAEFKEFRIGSEYLLFLKYFPKTGAFVASGPGSFDVRGQRVFKLTERKTWSEKRFPLDDRVGFLSVVNSVVDSCDS